MFYQQVQPCPEGANFQYVAEIVEPAPGETSRHGYGLDILEACDDRDRSFAAGVERARVVRVYTDGREEQMGPELTADAVQVRGAMFLEAAE